MSLKFIRQPIVRLHKYSQTEETFSNEATASVGDDDTEVETLPETFEAAMSLEECAPQVDRLRVRPCLRESMSDIMDFIEWPEPEELNFHNWTQEECKQLREIAALKKYKDWDTVARALNTGRTGYQCYVFLRTQAFRCEEMAAQWSTTETATLESIVDLFKMDKHIPWGRVANSMVTRTKMQCYVKFNMMSENARKGKYLDEEDCVLLSFVDLYGPRFRELSWILVGRSSLQLSARYKLLMNLQKLSTWTIADDIKLNYICTSWPLAEGETFQDVVDTAIEQNIKCFPKWDAESLKERLILLKAWNANNSIDGDDLSTAMRRCEWDQIKPKKGNIHFAQALLELSNKLQVELQSYQEAVWKKKGKKNSDLQNCDKCPLAKT